MPDPSRSALRIDGLEVRYPGRHAAGSPRRALRREPGEVVAIAGPSGCGKSTLLSVLLGLVPTWSGSVTVGDVDLADIDLDAWRAQLAWVPQRPHLFARSIAENVRLGRPDATDDEVRAAIADAGLEEVVARLPMGLGTVLGPRGRRTVGRRAAAGRPGSGVRPRRPLLLLDEPTANLDGRTEESVLAAVRRLMAGRTVLIVAHRPSLLALADRVVHLGPPGRWRHDGRPSAPGTASGIAPLGRTLGIARPAATPPGRSPPCSGRAPSRPTSV